MPKDTKFKGKIILGSILCLLSFLCLRAVIVSPSPNQNDHNLIGFVISATCGSLLIIWAIFTKPKNRPFDFSSENAIPPDTPLPISTLPVSFPTTSLPSANALDNSFFQMSIEHVDPD